MSITRDESKLLDEGRDKLADAEREAISEILGEVDLILRHIGIIPAQDDRAARLEAALIRYILESNK